MTENPFDNLSTTSHPERMPRLYAAPLPFLAPNDAMQERPRKRVRRFHVSAGRFRRRTAAGVIERIRSTIRVTCR
ncbi:hypothetical protein J2785_005245 [Burkholderia ambifaria]|nr:hypothetical protein [Burkholderia ambifaria]MDR6502065.1 hypothetical protein [Burkholderia ambifaria]